MTYRCTFFGHDYDSAEIEREEDQRGTVLVTTVREVEICRRCGERNVVHEYPITTPLEAADEHPAEPPTEHPSSRENESTPPNSTEHAPPQPQTPDEQTEPDGDPTDPTNYTCPECDFGVEAAASPLQAGDLCPDCHNGYLTAP